MTRYILLTIILITSILGCKTHPERIANKKIRQVVDTVGFAQHAWQVDSVINRINRFQGKELEKALASPEISWRTAICPHDDYTYVGWHYSAVLKNIKAKTIILFGVAHRAKQFGLADKLVFESFDTWQGAYGEIEVSELRSKLIEGLPQEMLVVHDSMHIVEHSLESMLPFLQHFNQKVEIVPILVPYVTFERMQEISKVFAKHLLQIMQKKNLSWGNDIAILITTDAVHYGDEEWGGKNYAPFGTDSLGYKKAVALEFEIINNCLAGELTEERIRKFFGYTVDPNDYKEYLWTWCGRYCIPFGLLTSQYLNQLTNGKTLSGSFIGYSTSIDHEPIPVDDLRMGRTAIATQRHWVGYTSVGYE